MFSNCEQLLLICALHSRIHRQQMTALNILHFATLPVWIHYMLKTCWELVYGMESDTALTGCCQGFAVGFECLLPASWRRVSSQTKARTLSAGSWLDRPARYKLYCHLSHTAESSCSSSNNHHNKSSCQKSMKIPFKTQQLLEPSEFGNCISQ